MGTGISTDLTADTLTDNTQNWGTDDLFGIYLNPNTGQTSVPPIVFPITFNDSTSITVDNTAYNLTDIALTGDTYIGEHYFDNLIIVNGAAVETFDDLYFGALDITGGTIQANNFYQQGKLKRENPLTKFVKFIKKVFTPEIDKGEVKDVVAGLSLRKKKAVDSSQKIVKLKGDTGINSQLVTTRLSSSKSLNNSLTDPINPLHPVKKLKENPKSNDIRQDNRINEIINLTYPLHPVEDLESPQSAMLVSIAPVSVTSEIIISEAEEDNKTNKIINPAYPVYPVEKIAVIQLPEMIEEEMIETDNSDIEKEVVKEILNPINPVKGNLTPDARNLKPVSGADPLYTYDSNNNRTSMTDPTGTTYYEYDVLNRLTSITNPNGEVTSFTYDALGRRTSMTYNNGVVTAYQYDAAIRLTGMSTDLVATNISSYSYTHDNVGNRLSMTDNYGVHNYTYDDQYRLVDATHPQAFNSDESFSYDPVGNRLTSHISSNYVYDNLNRLLEDDQFTYTYDNNGNLLSKTNKVSTDTTTYQYDSENRLIQVTNSTDITQYGYDGLGRRISKTVNGVVTKYIYDNEDILLELDENDNIKARYTHGPGIDEPISVDRDTDSDGVLDSTYYYQYDGLGSVTVMTDSSGAVVATYVYDAFGKIVQQTGTVENPYTFTAREWDEKAGLYYYRTRYYDANVGRFISEDPIGLAGGINLYVYVDSVGKPLTETNLYLYTGNNPVNFIDPTGQFSIDSLEYLELWLKLLYCPRAIYKCFIKTSCRASVNCAEEHRDPVKCFDRGETDLGSAHQLKTCLGKNPACTECMQAIFECGT